VTGGPAIHPGREHQRVCCPGSWGDDGFIVYAASPGPHLLRVSGTGACRNASKMDSTSPGGTLRMLWPSVLPGGKAVLFARSKEPAPQGTGGGGT